MDVWNPHLLSHKMDMLQNMVGISITHRSNGKGWKEKRQRKSEAAMRPGSLRASKCAPSRCVKTITSISLLLLT